MYIKSIIFSVIAVYITTVAFDYLLHRVALKSMYEKTYAVWRHPMLDSVNLLGLFFFSFIFVLLFFLMSGYITPSAGVIYGLCIGFLVAALEFRAYSYLPVPFMLIFWCILMEIVKGMTLGFITGTIFTTLLV